MASGRSAALRVLRAPSVGRQTAAREYRRLGQRGGGGGSHRRPHSTPLAACAHSGARRQRFRAGGADGLVRGERRALSVRAGRRTLGSSPKSRPSLIRLRLIAGVPASRRGASRTSGGRRGAAGAARAGSWRRRNGQKTRPIRASSSPHFRRLSWYARRSRVTSARRVIFTKRSTAPVATWRIGSRSVSSISMPIAPRPPPCGQTSCACGSPRWPMRCCAPCAALGCITHRSPKRQTPRHPLAARRSAPPRFVHARTNFCSSSKHSMSRAAAGCGKGSVFGGVGRELTCS